MMHVQRFHNTDFTQCAKVLRNAVQHFDNGNSCPLFTQIFCSFHTDQTTADNCDMTGCGCFSVQYVMGFVYMFLICPRNGQVNRLCSDRKDNLIPAALCDQRRIYRCVEMNQNAKTLRLFSIGQRRILHFHLPWCLTRSHKLTAQLVACFIYNRLMTALLQYAGCLQTGNTATCDQHPFRLLRRYQYILCFFSKVWISHTGNEWSSGIGKSVIAALITANAVYDFLQSAFLRLYAEVGIGKLRTSHDNHIRLILFQNFLRQLRCVDTSDRNTQHSGFPTDSGTVIHIKALWYINRRYLVFQPRCYHITTRDIQYIYSGLFCQPAKRNDILYGQAILQIIILCIQTHQQRHILRYALTNGADTVQREFTALFKCSAIGILTVIECR